MKKTTRRVYMSLLLVVLSVCTAVATTFAWVGITSNTTFDKFRINLRPNEEDNNSEYGIQLSLSGKEGTFYDEIQKEDLQRQILLNMGYEESYISRVGVDYLYRTINLRQCTVERNSRQLPSTSNMLLDFYDVNGLNLVTKRQNQDNKIITGSGFIFFDIYIAIYSYGGDEATLGAPNIFLKNHVLEGQDCSSNILNDIYLPNYFTNKISNKVTINSANAYRVGVQRFPITEKYNYSAYDLCFPDQLKIFKNGADAPTYNARSNSYDFGPVCELEDNFAYQYHKSIYGDTFDNVRRFVPFSSVINRGDITFEDGETSDSPNLILPQSMGFNSTQMIKYRIFFWAEGWDSDCFDAINGIPVTLNLEFSTKTNIE